MFEGIQCVVALERMVEEVLVRKDFHRQLEWVIIADYFKNADPKLSEWLEKAYERKEELKVS